MTSNRTPVVLHAHFYQPPRDNPWTESVEREPSAAPFHDWNERIGSECYNANAFARVFGDSDRVADIVNNYAYMSFNIGPTLFSWMASHSPDTVRRIVQADQESARRNGGHGNAIAQVYSHAILPLCNERDRNTQIRWGMADFRYRFGRAPEAMWLAETACDLATADALAAHGMRYIILSPHQAARVRYRNSKNWVDVSDGSINPRNPYRLSLPSGRSIVCFFYDGPTAHSISFEAVLDMSCTFADRLVRASVPGLDGHQLVHVATDGETYGHHRRFADRSLAYFVLHEAKAHNLELTNYAAYLDRTKVVDDVELKGGEGTAWSCAHGLGRWTRDCGCNSGGRPGWSQAWRTPLRAALDGLRDHAAKLFEEMGGDLLKDVWAARDAYVNVILDPRPETREAFLHSHARSQLNQTNRIRVLKLLEAQRMTQLMYASCGWFFDDLAGLETVQIMKYAAMAAQHLDSVSGRPYMPKLIEALSQGRSNDAKEGNGGDIFRNRVLPVEVTSKHRIARRASHLLFGEVPEVEQDLALRIEGLETETLERGSLRLVVGRTCVTRVRTEESEELTFAAATTTERDMHCGVAITHGTQLYEGLLRDARKCFERPTLTDVIRLIDQHLGPSYFSVRDLSDSARREYIENMITGLLDRLGATYSYLYDEHRRTIEAIDAVRVEVPRELRIVAEYTLARRLDAAVLDADGSDDKDMFRSALAVAREARDLGIKLFVPRSEARFAELLVDAARSLEKEKDSTHAKRLVDLVELIQALGLSLSLDRAQEHVFSLAKAGGLQTVPPDMRKKLFAALQLIDPAP